MATVFLLTLCCRRWRQFRQFPRSFANMKLHWVKAKSEISFSKNSCNETKIQIQHRLGVGCCGLLSLIGRSKFCAQQFRIVARNLTQAVEYKYLSKAAKILVKLVIQAISNLCDDLLQDSGSSLSWSGNNSTLSWYGQDNSSWMEECMYDEEIWRFGV